MIRYFILGFFFSISVIFIGHNIAEYNRSFDNCERLVSEINSNLEILNNEIQTLSKSMGVSYE